jgi:hypothetical protein
MVRELPRLIVGVAQPFSKHKGDFSHTRDDVKDSRSRLTDDA